MAGGNDVGGNDVGGNDAGDNYYYGAQAGFAVVVSKYPDENMVGLIDVYDWVELKDWERAQIEDGDLSSLRNVNIKKARILTRGSKHYKDYFHYDVGEYVVYVYPSVRTLNGGDHNDRLGIWTLGDYFYVIGTFFDREVESRRVPLVSPNVRQFVFPDGTSFTYDEQHSTFFADLGDGNYIKYDRADGELHIKVAGTITVKGEEIWLN